MEVTDILLMHFIRDNLWKVFRNVSIRGRKVEFEAVSAFKHSVSILLGFSICPDRSVLRFVAEH
jgi:hypothetical protein